MTKVLVMHGTPREYDQTILPCECGHEIEMEICYGRKPFHLFCHGCKTNYRNEITNCDADGAMRYFNRWRVNPSDNPYEIRKLESLSPEDRTGDKRD